MHHISYIREYLDENRSRSFHSTSLFPWLYFDWLFVCLLGRREKKTFYMQILFEMEKFFFLYDTMNWACFYIFCLSFIFCYEINRKSNEYFEYWKYIYFDSIQFRCYEIDSNILSAIQLQYKCTNSFDQQNRLRFNDRQAFQWNNDLSDNEWSPHNNNWKPNWFYWNSRYKK